MSDPVLRFYSAETLGEVQSLTPDGFLLCEGVPIARTGTLLYADGEVPLEPNSDGIIRVIRDPDEVFAPIAIASFAGKPICNEHPSEKVNPSNWKEYSVGTVLNPRRGDGLKYDNAFLYADLLIQDKNAIQDVREGKREVSAGYDAHYEQIKPGEGRQHYIVGNHVALVDKGRCGPRCSIGDSIGDKKMTKVNRPAWFDAIMQAHKTNDEERLVDTLEKITEMMGEVWLGKGTGKIKAGGEIANRDESGVHVHLHGMSKDDSEEEATGKSGSDPMAEVTMRLEALERAISILAQQEGGGEAEPKKEASDKKSKTKDARTKDEPEDEDEEEKSEDKKGTKDAKEDDDDEDDDKKDKKESKDSKTTKDGVRAMVGDSTSLRGAWQEVVSRAEILAPGIRIPTFDAKTSAKTTFDTMCQFRRRVLTEAMKEEDTRSAITSLAGSKLNLTQMTCDSVQMLFNGASEMVKRSTQDGGQRNPQNGVNYHSGTNLLVDTIRSINQKNHERYGIKA